MRKPVAEKLGWRVIRSRPVFEDKRFTVQEAIIALPEKSGEVTYRYAERAPTVILIPVTVDGMIVLQRQYRFPVDEWITETPAGSTADTGNLSLEEVARKELKEEIGATADRLEHIGEFYSAPAYSTEVCHIYIAWGVKLSEIPKPEPTEKIEIEIVPLAEALHRAEAGQIRHAGCALALLRARPVLERGLG